MKHIVNLEYKTHQILNLKWFLSHLDVAFAQNVEAMC